MNTPLPSTPLNYGHQFIVKARIPTPQLDNLFFLLITSIVAILLLGNMLFLDMHILQTTLSLAGICLILVTILYTIAKTTKVLSWGFLSAYCSLFLVAYYRSPLINSVFFLAGAIACVYTLCYLRPSFANRWLLLATSLITAITALGARNALSSFNIISRLSIGEAHQDTLYHASIGAMLKNYGVASTGLHGLVDIFYHTFSHWLIAGISSLSTIGVLEVYGVILPLLFIPLLLFSVTAFCLYFNPEQNYSAIALWWILGCLALTVVPALFRVFMVYDAFFISESYLIALTLFLTILPLLWCKNITLSELICLAAISLCIGFAKVSVGVIFMGLWWARCLFFKKEAKFLVATFLVSCMVAIPLFVIGQKTSASEVIDVFGTLRDHSYWGRYIDKLQTAYTIKSKVPSRYLWRSGVCVALFMIFHFSMSWIVIAHSTYGKGLKDIFSSPLALYSLAAVGGSSFIAMVLNPPGGAAYYFTNVAFFISVPACILLLFSLLSKTINSPPSSKIIRVPSKLLTIVFIIPNAKAMRKLVLVPCIFLTMLFIIPNVKAMRKLVRKHIPTQTIESPFIQTLLTIQRRAPLNLCIEASPEMLHSNPMEQLSEKTFVYPAVSERPWTNILVPPPLPQKERAKPPYQWFSFQDYGITPDSQVVDGAPKLIMNDNKGILQLSPVEDVIQDIAQHSPPNEPTVPRLYNPL